MKLPQPSRLVLDHDLVLDLDLDLFTPLPSHCSPQLLPGPGSATNTALSSQ
jgi:hypothetical protein